VEAEEARIYQCSETVQVCIKYYISNIDLDVHEEKHWSMMQQLSSNTQYCKQYVGIQTIVERMVLDSH